MQINKKKLLIDQELKQYLEDGNEPFVSVTHLALIGTWFPFLTLHNRRAERCRLEPFCSACD
jgi:hypothetical protein